MNFVGYFENICKTLKLTKDEFFFGRVTGLNYLEDMLRNMRSEKAFFLVEDVDDGVTTTTGSGYFDRKAIVIYILKSYAVNDQVEREEKLNECRQVRKKVQSRLIRDVQKIPELAYLNRKRMPYHELPGYFASGVCGFYMTIALDEPLDLRYNPDDWTD